MTCGCGTTAIEKKHGKLPALKEADIIFIRHKRNILRFFLRRILKSYWDHTALILYPQHKSHGTCHGVIVESIRNGFFSLWLSRGISIHKFDKYLNNPRRYDVGIKRVPHMTQIRRERVVTHMLTNIDAPYWPWNYAYAIAVFFLPFLRQRFLSRQRFSCSAFIQIAYYSAEEWRKKHRVVFKQGVYAPIEFQEIITPADIANSDKTEWLYNER